MSKTGDQLQLDLATVILRIDQVHSLPIGDPLRELLIDRLGTCDSPRLRRYLTETTIAVMAEL